MLPTPLDRFFTWSMLMFAGGLALLAMDAVLAAL